MNVNKINTSWFGTVHIQIQSQWKEIIEVTVFIAPRLPRFCFYVSGRVEWVPNHRSRHWQRIVLMIGGGLNVEP